MPRSSRARRQLAIRRLCLDARGALNPDAKVLIADLRRFCRADGQPTLAYSPATGQLDPVATVAIAARREVYDRLMRYLTVDEVIVQNIREEDE